MTGTISQESPSVQMDVAIVGHLGILPMAKT